MDINNTKKLKIIMFFFSKTKIAGCQGQEEAGQAAQGH
jgi:hypothetical protein